MADFISKEDERRIAENERRRANPGAFTTPRPSWWQRNFGGGGGGGDSRSVASPEAQAAWQRSMAEYEASGRAAQQAGRKRLNDQSRTEAYDPGADMFDPGNLRPVDFQGQARWLPYAPGAPVAEPPKPQGKPVTKLTSTQAITDKINKSIGVPQPPPPVTNADFLPRGPQPQYSTDYDVPGDRPQFAFPQLPDGGDLPDPMAQFPIPTVPVGSLPPYEHPWYMKGGIRTPNPRVSADLPAYDLPSYVTARPPDSEAQHAQVASRSPYGNRQFGGQTRGGKTFGGQTHGGMTSADIANSIGGWGQQIANAPVFTGRPIFRDGGPVMYRQGGYAGGGPSREDYDTTEREGREAEQSLREFMEAYQRMRGAGAMREAEQVGRMPYMDDEMARRWATPRSAPYDDDEMVRRWATPRTSADPYDSGYGYARGGPVHMEGGGFLKNLLGIGGSILGNLIPIPVVGPMIGKAAGTTLGNLVEGTPDKIDDDLIAQGKGTLQSALNPLGMFGGGGKGGGMGGIMNLFGGGGGGDAANLAGGAATDAGSWLGGGGGMDLGSMSGFGFATGGPTSQRGGYPELYNKPVRRAFSTGGGDNYVRGDGHGDGRSDHIDAVLSPGEYVMDSETTALLGDGDNEAGARKFDHLRKNIRREKGKALAKGKISPNANKSAAAYLPKGEKTKLSASDRLAHGGMSAGFRQLGRR